LKSPSAMARYCISHTASEILMKCLSAAALLLSLLLGALNVSYAQIVTDGPNGKSRVHTPKGGIVPDAETAKKIAEAVLVPIYGAEAINQQKPFDAVLKKGVWHISGKILRGVLGGSFQMEIIQKDGRVVRIFHDR
jgi:hypothetical protein